MKLESIPAALAKAKNGHPVTIEDLRLTADVLEDVSGTLQGLVDEVSSAEYELRDVLEDWEENQACAEPDPDDFAPNDIEEYHFAVKEFEDAQKAADQAPDLVEEILKRLPM